MALILLVMFFLGSLQMLWALLQILFTRRAKVRRHLGLYFIGVAAFFILLDMLSFLMETQVGMIFYAVYFFASAWGLAYYYLLIVFMPAHAEDMPASTFKQPIEVPIY
jgi:hypothetical protein